jgi:hypothetical protein
VPFAGPAAEPPWAAQAPAASRRLQIASCGFRSGAAGGVPLCRWHVKARGRLSSRPLGGRKAGLPGSSLIDNVGS